MNHIKKFNNRSNEYLNAIIRGIKQGEKQYSVSNIRYYKLSFKNQKDHELNLESSVEVRTEEFEGEQPSDFLSYYWVTFTFDNKTEYKIAMYYKDFDHVSGNIHVLPGFVQVFTKRGDKEIDTFVLEKDKTSTIIPKYGFEKPGDKCNGGRAFGEGSWIPCLGSSLLTREHYTIFRSEKCAEYFGREMLIDPKNLSNKDFYSKYCLKSVDASEIHTKELLKEIYPDKKGISYGAGTYKLFKWLNLKEDGDTYCVTKNADATYIYPLYNIVYIQGKNAEGVYCVFGQNQKEILFKYNDNKTSPNIVIENSDGTYYWEINGKVLMKENNTETNGNVIN
ncbi:MAG: hypothetical protein K6E10_10455 [Eubacterium sp.]|nr:hypothetical protein [Eubacterium sp.]